jgi:hypothetical protein
MGMSRGFPAGDMPVVDMLIMMGFCSVVEVRVWRAENMVREASWQIVGSASTKGKIGSQASLISVKQSQFVWE